jgi:asparagine synthetase B (glutamine-hydrolysing)
MCGLVGIVGAGLSSLHLETFKWLLHLDTIRGEDSTGIAVRRSFLNKKTQPQIIIAKAEGHPSNLVRKFPELFDARSVLYTRANERFDFLMGHNRAATIGAVNATNAHPFHHGMITGCHNGTITGKLSELPVGEEIEGHTDSEKLIFALSKGWTIKKIMDTITGAAAISWWDSEKKTFNLYRNKERPLYITHNDAKTVYAYSSEEWILKVALAKGKLPELIKNIKEFKVDEHLEIVLSDNKIQEVKVTSVPPLVVPTTTTTCGGGHTGNVTTFANKNGRFFAQKKFNWLQSGVNKEKETFRPNTGWLDLSRLTRVEFDKAAKTGCALCQTDLEYEDHVEGFVKWIDKETPMCLSCSKDFKEAS